MKRLLLLSALGFATLGVSAQTSMSTMIPGTDTWYVAKQPAQYHTLKTFRQYKENPASETPTGIPSRRYSYFNHVNSITGAFDNGSGLGTGSGIITCIPIWFDSTVRQLFTSGYGAVNFSSVCQMIDPAGSLIFNDPANPDYAGKLKITNRDIFQVDSVIIDAVYVGNPSRPKTIVDTLIISLANQNNIYYYWNTASYPWAAKYLHGKDTLWGTAPIGVDGAMRAAISNGPGSPAAVVWKVPLTDDMRDYTGGTVNNFFAFAPPSTYTVPAGNKVLVSVAFKSGDKWIPNVDSITRFHRFMPIAGGSAKAKPYYWYDLGDRNGASLMFSANTTFYAPAEVIEGTNTLAFCYEFLDISAVMSCSSCVATSINDKKIVSNVEAYPNPAINDVTIPFTVRESADVRVSITNAVGQAIASQEMGRFNASQSGKAAFSISSLSSGVYFYTVEANGQRVTNRIVVAH